MIMIAQSQPQATPEEVTAKALFNTQEQLGLTQQELAEIIGLHRTSVSRVRKEGRLDPHSKNGELALMLIRVFRSLYTLFGGQQDDMRHFLRTANRHTGGIPLEQMQQIQGLVKVVEYLDAIRGKI
ncbi:MAG: DUF2384 domain-containing protein [Gammaproteobacteria bacterium]|nr:DUF2384 domain-containing protein [Gammaproteobacteria bacterium]